MADLISRPLAEIAGALCEKRATAQELTGSPGDVSSSQAKASDAATRARSRLKLASSGSGV